MKILKNVYNEIINVPFVPPEIGGIIGGTNKIIDCVYIDNYSFERNSSIYVPNVQRLNDHIANWKNNGSIFYGIFHSHFFSQERLSLNDQKYITTIMNCMPSSISELYFPIVIPKRKIVSYLVFKHNGNFVIQNDFVQII